MTLKLFRRVVLLLSVVPTAWAAPACPLPDGPLSLAQVVDLGLCNNPSTHAARANVLAQEAQVEIARGAYWPTVAATLGATRQYAGGSAREETSTNQYSAGASVNYLLYDAGARSAKEASARRTLDAVLATQESTTQTVLLSAVAAFYQLQSAAAAQESATTSEAQARQNLAAAVARYQAGTATPLDRLQAQTALSQAVLTRINADGEVRNQQAVLVQVLGLPPATTPILEPARVAAGTVAEPVQGLIETALRERADLKAAQARVAAAQASIEQTRAGDAPTVSLSASQSLVRSQPGSNTHGTSFGVQLSIPIFSGFIPRYQVRAGEASLAAAEAERDRLTLAIAQEVVKAHNSVETSGQSWQASRDLLAAAARAHEVAKKRYEAGAGSYLDLQSAQVQLDSARAQEIQSRFNWQIARFTLAQAVGVLNKQSVEQGQ